MRIALVLLALAACADTTKIVEAKKIPAEQVCAGAAASYRRCSPDDPLSAADQAGCVQEVESGGLRSYWECVAQLDCSNRPGSCERAASK
jgi:hypothetical protein